MSGLNLMWALLLVATFSWTVANALVCAVAPLLKTVTGQSVRRHLWLVALLPWLLPTGAVIGLLMLALAKSQDWIHHHCETHLAHHPHFCLEHLPQMALSFLSSAVGLVIIAGVVALVATRILTLMRIDKASRGFRRMVSKSAARVTVADPRPLAFTLGVIKPVIVITDGLRKALNPRQLRMVVKHEVAHARHNDVLKNTLFELLLCAHFFPSLLRAPWCLSSELRADRDVVAQFDRLDLADVLLTLRRAGATPPAPNSAFPVSIAGGQLLVRVNALLDGRSKPAPKVVHVVYFAALGFPVLLLLNHHGLEIVWGWFL
ncbi:MAG TPA: M56 family metallopeptidase [Marinagarivorans sp.]